MVPLVVVENHSHALFYIHQQLRGKKIAGNRWKLVHFDSHADLACPGNHVPARACFRPNDAVLNNSLGEQACGQTDDEEEGSNLYDLLDSTPSGIAEWILPLALAANLCKIYWVRPGTSTKRMPLIPAGDHSFCVGVVGDSAAATDCKHFMDLPTGSVVKVDSRFLYYLEDGAYAPTANLLLPRDLHLRVCDVKASDSAASTLLDDTSMQYVLDICLDFFFCVNPFLADLEDLNIEAAHALADIVSSSALYNGSSSSLMEQDPENALATIELFRSNVIVLLNSLATKLVDDSHRFRQEFLSLLGRFYENEKAASTVADSIFLAATNVDEHFVSLAVEALPYLLLPHDELASQASIMEERLDVFRRELRQMLLEGQQPFLITIARSAEDGFIPKDVVGALQSAVLQIIGQELQCDLEVHLDDDVLDDTPTSST